MSKILISSPQINFQKPIALVYLFIDSALWVGSVIESPGSSVCRFVTKIVIVDKRQSIRFFVVVFFHKNE